MKQLFGIPPRREEPEEVPSSARSNASGDSNDSPSFGKMKLVIKNTFIGGYDEPLDDDDDRPPPTLARSASDSKLDCQSSTSSVVFWYPQRGGANMSQSNSSVASRSDAGQDDDDHPHPYGEPHHQLFDRNKRGSLEQVALDHHNLPYAGDVPVDLPGKPSFSQVHTVPSQMPVPNRAYEGLQGRAEEQFCPPGTFDKPNSSFGEMIGQVSSPSRPPGYFDGRQTASLDRAVRATGPAGSAGPSMRPPQTFEPQPQIQRNGLDLSVNDFGDQLGPLNRDDPLKADLGDLPPAAQLAQLQMLQNELMRGSRLEAPMGMMPLKTQEFGAASAQAPGPDRHLAFGASNGVPVVQQQLRQQLLESQMQQMQLQQQMQQLQLRQQQLHQQLTQPASAAGEEEAALTQVPYNDEGEPASLGSRLHPDSCNPCIFWFKDKALCNKGVMCDFCHFRHPGQKNKRIRPSKNTRLQMRAAQAARAVA